MVGKRPWLRWEEMMARNASAKPIEFWYLYRLAADEDIEKPHTGHVQMDLHRSLSAWRSL